MNDFTIRYGVNRSQVLIRYVLCVYDNTTVKFKLFLYDVVKPLDANGNQFLTFDETNNITIMSLSELQNKTNNLKNSYTYENVNYHFMYLHSIVEALKEGFFDGEYPCAYPKLSILNLYDNEIVIDFEENIFEKENL